MTGKSSRIPQGVCIESGNVLVEITFVLVVLKSAAAEKVGSYRPVLD